MANRGIYVANEAGTAWVQLGQGAIPADTTAPTVPASFRVTATTSTSITVAWNASTDTETGVGGYDVSIDGGAFITLGTVLTYTFDTLAPSTSHTMRVRARDKAATPNLSPTASVVGSTQAAPVTTPQNLRVSGTSTTTAITFAWDAPASTPTGTTLSRYEWRVASGTFATNGSATTKQVTGLTADTSYTFGVRAVFSDSTASAEVTLTARTAAAAGGGGTGSSVYVGLHVVVPTAGDVTANPELAPYRTSGTGSTLTQLQSMQKWESDMNALTGFTDNPLMTIGHAFMTSATYSLTSWATTQMNRFPAMLLNFKPGGGSTTAAMQNTASGAEDTVIKNMIAGLPAGKRIYLTYFHEPDETGGAFATAWRQASARWAKLIIDNRGTKDLHPMICLTTWSFRPANATIQSQFLSVTNDYEALGIDWRTQVVQGPDGYEDKSLDAGNPPNAATTFTNVFPQLKAAGWTRFGITETATSSKAGASGSATVTAADATAAPIWQRSLMRYVTSFGGFEYVCWFNATGSKGPTGSWLYTNTVKKQWGEAAHFKGLPPTWPNP